MLTSRITELLGSEADSLLSYTARGFIKEKLQLPGSDFVDRVLAQTDRPHGAFVDATGRILIADSFNDRIIAIVR